MQSRGSAISKSLLWWSSLADVVLRGGVESTDRGSRSQILAGTLILMTGCGLVYGCVMGSYSSEIDSIRPRQVMYSAIKVPLLLLATYLLSLPSFYVANTMLGLQDDFGRAVRALVSTQAALTIVLAALAPFTMFWYVCGSSYNQALALNAIIFGIASLSVQVLLRNLYRPLIEKNRLHVWMIRAWLVIYAFVGIQMGWVLRPFIGSPDMATTFLRDEAWGNAYLVVFEIFANLLGK